MLVVFELFFWCWVSCFVLVDLLIVGFAVVSSGLI